jgi:hypothetical protein
MAKGRQPRPRSKVPDVTPRHRPKPKGDGGGVIDTAPVECWTFPLVSPTSAGNTVKKGASARGAIQDTRIAVFSTGLLGYAPMRESKEMITALQRTRGSLVGEVVVEAREKKAQVRLCLS